MDNGTLGCQRQSSEACAGPEPETAIGDVYRYNPAAQDHDTARASAAWESQAAAQSVCLPLECQGWVDRDWTMVTASAGELEVRGHKT
eukprot:3412103-Rhodomonas_salina.1